MAPQLWTAQFGDRNSAVVYEASRNSLAEAARRNRRLADAVITHDIHPIPSPRFPVVAPPKAPGISSDKRAEINNARRNTYVAGWFALAVAVVGGAFGLVNELAKPTPLPEKTIVLNCPGGEEGVIGDVNGHTIYSCKTPPGSRLGVSGGTNFDSGKGSSDIGGGGSSGNFGGGG